MGFFHPEEKTELIDGLLYHKPRQSPAHGAAVMRVFAAFHERFDGWYAGLLSPVILAEDGEPEPDFSLVRGKIGDYMTDHPTAADVGLIIEIADTSLDFDRGRKASYYAEAGIADYWLVNLIENVLEVRRGPVAVPDTPFGFAYSDVRSYAPGESVAPLAAPGSPVAVSSLLPPANAAP